MGGKPEPRREYVRDTWGEIFKAGLQRAELTRILDSVGVWCSFGTLESQALRAVASEVYRWNDRGEHPPLRRWPPSDHPWAATIEAIADMAPRERFDSVGDAVAPFVCEIMRALVGKHGHAYFLPMGHTCHVGCDRSWW